MSRSQRSHFANNRPTPVTELPLVAAPLKPSKGAGILERLKYAYWKINQVLAGMYTGVSCYGVPKEHQCSSSPEKEAKPEKKPAHGG